MIYFAWVDVSGSAGAAEFGPEHLVHDENVIAFDIEHNEGDFATLTLEVENPRRGPLAPGPIWAWLSWLDDANPSADAVPLFFGRLIGVPSGIIGSIITYLFRARPSDYADVKAALADTLRELPFYDEMFIAEEARSDPDAVLEGYTKTYHIDRVSHEVSVSEFLTGEDGVEVFDPSEVIYDSVDITLDRPPLTSVKVDGEAPWSQTFGGITVNIPPRTFSSTSALENWPKAGDELAGGYYVISSSATDPHSFAESHTINFSWRNEAKEHRDNDVMSNNISETTVVGAPFAAFELGHGAYSVPSDKHTGTPFSAGTIMNGIAVVASQFTGALTLGVSAKRDRKDLVSLTVVSDLQPVLRDPEDTSDSEAISLGAANVGDGCGSDPTPIEDNNRSQYLPTDRGLQSIQYMVARARAKLVIGARVVSISWECPFARAVNLSCRKTAQIFDPRIPGEAAIGKIVSYSLRGDGRTGEFRGAVKIACAVGLGNAITTSDGEADYVDEDYVDHDYQTFTGKVVALPSGDIGISPPIPTNEDPGFSGIGARNLVISDTIVNEPADEAVLGSYPGPRVIKDINGINDYVQEGVRRAAEALTETKNHRLVELVNLEGPGGEISWTVATTPLVIPRQIDLEAASTV